MLCVHASIVCRCADGIAPGCAFGTVLRCCFVCVCGVCVCGGGGGGEGTHVLFCDCVCQGEGRGMLLNSPQPPNSLLSKPP